MKVFISAGSSRNFFRDGIENLIKTEYNSRHESIFIPLEPSSARDETLLNRIRTNILDSHLFLMDVTPERLTNGNHNIRWVTNQGVLIEYGILVGIDWLYKLCVFCEETVDRTHVHPAVHKSIDSYTEGNTEDFKVSLRTIIRRREQTIEEEVIQKELQGFTASVTGT